MNVAEIAVRLAAGMLSNDHVIDDGREMSAAAVDLAEYLHAELVNRGHIKPEHVEEAPAEDDWSDAPDWAEYRAMDADGVWYYYSGTPHQGHGAWLPGLHTCDMAPDRPSTAGIDWRESLQRRPRRKS